MVVAVFQGEFNLVIRSNLDENCYTFRYQR